MAGQYQLVTVKYGTRVTRKSDVFLNNAIYGEADAPIEMDYFFWIARNRERVIVIDTGFSLAGGTARARTMLVEPPRAFDALGVEPSSSPTVIITHAHYDHIGNIRHFPSSELVISAAEHAFWGSKHWLRQQFHHSVEESELSELAAADRQGRVTTFTERYNVAPGIDVIEIGGHTPGQSVVKVDTAEGVVLLASDAIHYYEEYERDMPFAFLSSLLDTYIGFDRIRDMVESGEVSHVIPGHDPATLERLRAIGSAGFPLQGTEFETLAVAIGTIDGEDS